MNLSVLRQRHTRHPRMWIVLYLVLAATIGAAGAYVHEGQRAKLRVLGSQLADLNTEVAGLKVESMRRQHEVVGAGAQQSAEQMRASLAAHTRVQLLQQGHLSALIDDLMRLAQQDGIQVISITPGELQDHGGYVELPITMRVQARFRNLGEYLHQVQQLQQLVLVGRVHAELAAVEQASLNVQMETVSFIGKA